MLIVVDEAEGVSEPIYEAIEAVMPPENCRILMIGNPTTMSGSFRRAFYEDRELYRTITISALDSPNVTEGKTVLKGLTTKRWVEERRKVPDALTNLTHLSPRAMIDSQRPAAGRSFSDPSLRRPAALFCALRGGSTGLS